MTTIIDNLADISPDLWNNKPLLNLYSINYTHYLHQAPVRPGDGRVTAGTRPSTSATSSKLRESTQDGLLALILFSPLVSFTPAHQSRHLLQSSKHNLFHPMDPLVTKLRNLFQTLNINQKKKAKELHWSQLPSSAQSYRPYLRLMLGQQGLCHLPSRPPTVSQSSQPCPLPSLDQRLWSQAPTLTNLNQLPHHLMFKIK